MSLYQQLQSADPVLAKKLVAATAQAFGWDAPAIAQWCSLTGADPVEVREIIHVDRIAKDRARDVHG